MILLLAARMGQERHPPIGKSHNDLGEHTVVKPSRYRLQLLGLRPVPKEFLPMGEGGRIDALRS